MNCICTSKTCEVSTGINELSSPGMIGGESERYFVLPVPIKEWLAHKTKWKCYFASIPETFETVKLHFL